MANKKVLKLVLPGKNGINAVLDITKIDAATSDLEKRVAYLEGGARKFALKDFSKPENQHEMVPNIYYYVAFDESNQYVQLKEDGTTEGSTQIHHFDIYYKDDEGAVRKVATQYTAANLQDVAYTNKLAVFKAGIQKEKPGNFDDLDDKDLVAKGEIKPKLDGVTTDITNITNVIGKNAEHAALKNKANTFEELNTFKKGIEFSNVDHNNIVMKSGVNTGVSVDGSKGINMAVLSNDNKKHASVIVGAEGNANFAKLVANNATGGVAGKIEVKFDGEKVVATAPTPAEGAGDTEIATVKTIKDAVGDLDPANVAYKNKDNEFTKSQTIIGEKIQTKDGEAPEFSEQGLVKFKASHYDYGAGTFDEDTIKNVFNAVTSTDKTGKKLGHFATRATATGTSSELSVVNKDGSAEKTISVNYDRASGKFTSHALTVEDAKTAGDTEIVTFGGLQKVFDPDGSGGNIGEVIEQLKNVAYVNKPNEFSQAQKITTDAGTIEIGDNTLSADAESELTLAAGENTLTISSQGIKRKSHITSESDNLELTDKKYVDDAISKNATPDATTDVKGKVELATDDEVKQGTDKVVPTAKQLRKAVDDKIQVITNDNLAIDPGVFYIVVEEDPECVIDTKPTKYYAPAGTEQPIGITLAGVKADNVTVTITGTGATLKDGAGEAQATLTKTAKISEINIWLKNVKVVVAKGNVKFVCTEGSIDVTIPVEVDPQCAIQAKPEKYSGAKSSEVALGITLTGARAGNITVNVTGTGATLKDNGAGAQAKLTKTDTIANVNAWLKNIKVVITKGSVKFDCAEAAIDVTIPVEETPAG